MRGFPEPLTKQHGRAQSMLETGGRLMAFALTSSAFKEGESIPKQYTGDGRNVSPPLKWRDLAAGTRTLALVCEDPDAPRGTFTHWVIFNVPAESVALSEGVPAEATLPDGA